MLAGNGKCVVSYAVYSDDGQRFKATVTVANRDYRAIKNWNLWFIMQGDQVLSGAAGKVSLDQQGTTVTVKGSELLSPQKSKTMTITGRYTASNKAPMVFQLGSEDCATYVSEKPGEPSKPVVRLPNGKIGLGEPVKDNPVPGLSVGPDGVVTPTSIPATTSPPPKGNPSASPAKSDEVLEVDCTITPEDPACRTKPSPPDPSTTPPSSEPAGPPSSPPQSEDNSEDDTGIGAGGDDEGVPGPLPGA